MNRSSTPKLNMCLSLTSIETVLSTLSQEVCRIQPVNLTYFLSDILSI